jgi:hypothetical protein
VKTPVIFASAILFALLVAAGAFWGGMSVGKAQAQSEQNSILGGQGPNPNNLPAGGILGGGTGAGPVPGGPGAPGAPQGPRGNPGTITRVEGDILTITRDQGQVFTVRLSNDTRVVKNVFGSRSDLKPGAHVLIQGAPSGNGLVVGGVQITDLPPAPQP